MHFYLRTTRGKTPVIYGPDDEFSIVVKVLPQSDRDESTVVASGITVHEALKAYEQLKAGSITLIESCIQLFIKPERFVNRNA